ncbi:MAG: nucleotide exchange factor GrpE [Candidatus Thermoplasmatota archaeon]|nr:nucleotide exchange factor GrpE [Candidatus Thermoplasmatota archaeon]
MAGRDPQEREPTTEIVETPEGARVTVELPGVTQEAIRIAVSRDILKLEADGTRGRFSTIQALPFEPDPDGISVTFSQGVLDIILARKQGELCQEGERSVPVVSPIDASLEQMEKEMDGLRMELSRISEEKRSLEERVIFLQKDYQNQRRRHEGEKEAVADRRIEELAGGLIDVLDSFKLARESLERSRDGGNALERMKKGIVMIENQVTALFQRIGISKIVTEGQHFDPNFHEAVGSSEDGGTEDETIVKEVTAGYVYKEKALRPAQVIVNRKPQEEAPIKTGRTTKRDKGKK